MRDALLRFCAIVLACGSIAATQAQAQPNLIARGTLTTSRAGYYKDLSGLNYTLENGVSANLLGGLGSGLTYVSGDTFLAVPDRGPNAVSYNSLIDDTASYVERFHTIQMQLLPNPHGTLPFRVEPKLKDTTLLFALAPLHYGDGTAYGVPSGVPPINSHFRHYFSGRSDDFNSATGSDDQFDARLDAESIRVSNDGWSVFISDEYGPYVYQFSRLTGERIRSFQLPPEFYVAHKNTTTASEQAANTSGRVPNKGMEGLAITPDGRKLVGILQAATIQDAAAKQKKLLRMAVIDIASGKVIHEFGYLLTDGSGVSDIIALNNHEFIVDERDGNGLGDGSTAVVKKLYKIDLAKAIDITGMTSADAAAAAASTPKSLFLDIVGILNANGIVSMQIPAKLEGVTFGSDVRQKGKTIHTIWVANDNDFLQDYAGITNSNPNQYFVFGFTDADLAGSVYVPQHVERFPWEG
ncbi:conserved hypothetical protein [Candidatus Koribacter versatilis Ellin345]|uniref:Phytase-like domain-containing protein n=1 Tax=Koribacter versatilis (strain Ellin345) TaxID=204669 RepID=Q1IKP5_KORVE|nr:esterase-like activity of phytase family protein [Candidatus Koribacter versatilis]ABF42555.1 conserved hypothetical protein [Candidatus Koribacter versatilis Ellin345]